jgi:predicted secreted protein
MALEPNPTTGYKWEVDFDESRLKLAQRDFTPAKTGLTGAGGEQSFTFKGVKTGKTEVTFTYERQWE